MKNHAGPVFDHSANKIGELLILTTEQGVPHPGIPCRVGLHCIFDGLPAVVVLVGKTGLTGLLDAALSVCAVQGAKVCVFCHGAGGRPAEPAHENVRYYDISLSTADYAAERAASFLYIDAAPLKILTNYLYSL